MFLGKTMHFNVSREKFIQIDCYKINGPLVRNEDLKNSPENSVNLTNIKILYTTCS